MENRHLSVRRPKHPVQLALSIGVVVVMAVLFLVWRYGHADTSTAGQIAALLSAALFTAVAVRFIAVWTADWRADTSTPVLPDNCIPPVVPVKIFLALLIGDIAAVLFVFVLQVISGERDSFFEALDFWTCTDSQHYLAIAEDWYLREGDWDRLVQLVFLPGYPLVVKLFSFLTGEYLCAGMLVSALSFAGAGTVLYCLARLDMGHDAALRVVKYACILPGSFFYAAPMSESLFLLCSLACVYAARRSRWVWGGVFGGLAAFTRSLGLVLVIPMGYELLTGLLRQYHQDSGFRSWKPLARLAALLLVPAGFGVYCLINWDIAGDPLKFMEYQRVHWGQSLGLFFNTAAYQLEYAVSCFREGDYETMMGLWIANLLASFGCLAIMLPAVGKLRPSYTAYFLPYFVIAIGATWLLSAPRYCLVLFPVSFALAALTENPRRDALATVGLTAVSVLYAYMFVNRWQVW